ncbi:hypothetical protein [Streptomyces sp. SID3343]|uniref:hypothetical protein n=1 Tax=Streptomyces sp. SID3343 TaxID=2690260 RepID=UPI00136805E4|nr:hypothetical protein [Streptomyces sp. SID3343]MYW06579.1 hypothetical protein [Streptomyces sp. SID3343]
MAVPLRPVVRLLAGALLVCAALMGAATPVLATSVTVPSEMPVVCPFHPTTHGKPGVKPDDKGDGSSGCGTRSHACLPATVPPLPPLIAPPPTAVTPPWLVHPDTVQVAVSAVAAQDSPDLTVLCVSRT